MPSDKREQSLGFEGNADEQHAPAIATDERAARADGEIAERDQRRSLQLLKHRGNPFVWAYSA